MHNVLNFLSKFIKHDSSDDFSYIYVKQIFVMLITDRAEIILIKSSLNFITFQKNLKQ